MASKLPPKKDVCVALLEKASVFLHIDPRKEQVAVPPWFKKQPQLVLQVGLNMAVPIPDLNVDDECVSCTLSFNRSPFFCWVPWSAVFALVGEDGRGMVWPDDIPPEVAAQAQKVAAKQAGDAKAASRRGHLRAVGQEDASDARDDAAGPAADPATVSSGPSAEAAESSEEQSSIGMVPSDVKEESGADAPLVAGAETEPPPHAAPEDAEEEEQRPSTRKLPPYLRVVK